MVYIIIIDLKVCYFTIPLQEQDREKFAFTAPTFNNVQPVKWYHWHILPQGMLNNSNLCQCFVNQPRDLLCKQFTQSIIYHYMDDILIAASDMDILEKVFAEVWQILPQWGLKLLLRKFEEETFLVIYDLNWVNNQFNYKGYRLKEINYILNDFQKLLGHINWLQRTIGLPTQELSNLFQILQGDSDLNCSRHLTVEAEKELTQVQQEIQNAYVDQLDLTTEYILVILPFNYPSNGVIMQREDNSLQWIF